MKVMNTQCLHFKTYFKIENFNLCVSDAIKFLSQPMHNVTRIVNNEDSLKLNLRAIFLMSFHPEFHIARHFAHLRIDHENIC